MKLETEVVVSGKQLKKAAKSKWELRASHVKSVVTLGWAIVVELGTKAREECEEETENNKDNELQR